VRATALTQATAPVACRISPLVALCCTVMVAEGGENVEQGQGPGYVQSEDTGVPREAETYSVEEAAKALGRTPGRIRQMLRAGELAGEHEDGDPARPWRVPKWAVHAMRDEAQRPAQEAATTPRDPSVSTASLLRQVQDLQRELGRMEARAARGACNVHRPGGEGPSAKGARRGAPACRRGEEAGGADQARTGRAALSWLLAPSLWRLRYSRKLTLRKQPPCTPGTPVHESSLCFAVGIGPPFLRARKTRKTPGPWRSRSSFFALQRCNGGRLFFTPCINALPFSKSFRQ